VPNPQPFAGRNQPFTRVTTSTLVSPPLFAPINSGDFVTIADANLAPVKLHYKLALTTKDGRTVTSDLRCLPVRHRRAHHRHHRTLHHDLQRHVPGPAHPPARRPEGRLRPTGAPGRPLPAHHRHPAHRGRRRFNRNQDGTVKEQAAFPILASADVHIEELDAIGGPQGVSTTLSYEDSIYLPHGFGGDPTAVRCGRNSRRSGRRSCPPRTRR